MDFFQLLSKKEITSYFSARPGEEKIGETIPEISSLTEAFDTNVKFVIIGVPEDFGPRANCGLKGASSSFNAFLSKFLNIQSNPFFPENSFVLGQVETHDLQAKSINKPVEELRDIVAELDQRVTRVIKTVVEQELIPIVIGGGHNNAYPIIKGVSEALKHQIGVINCDPHADFRSLEGRHSGNPFSYAFQSGYLSKYGVIGLHESYNNSIMFEELEKNNNCYYSTFEDLLDSGNFKSHVLQMYETLGEKRIGLELDLDAIEYMPSSAFTPSGLSVNEARLYIRLLASFKPYYLHLPEGAINKEEDKVVVGKTLAYLVSDFIKKWMG